MVKLTSILTGHFKLDGGAMFGIVPKRMWQKIYPADEDNLCTWAMRCLLLEYGDKKVLIDTGIGNKQDDKFKSHFLPSGIGVADKLDQLGVSPEEITDVLLTHLHFDHVGGALKYNAEGTIVPTFPNAKYWTGEEQYKSALNPNEKEKASFLGENILPLEKLGLIHFIATEKDDFKFDDSMSLRFVHGHTQSMLVPFIHMPDQTDLVFCADLLPSTAHLGLPYVLAYDIEPLKSIEEKKRLIEDAIAFNQDLFLEHDNYHEVVQIGRDEKGKTCVKNNVIIKKIF